MALSRALHKVGVNRPSDAILFRAHHALLPRLAEMEKPREPTLSPFFLSRGRESLLSGANEGDTYRRHPITRNSFEDKGVEYLAGSISRLSRRKIRRISSRFPVASIYIYIYTQS